LHLTFSHAVEGCPSVSSKAMKTMLSNYDANLIHFVYSQRREQEDWQTASIPHADNAGFQ